MSHFISFIAGIVVATVGFSGIFSIADRAVDTTKAIVSEQASK